MVGAVGLDDVGWGAAFAVVAVAVASIAGRWAAALDDAPARVRTDVRRRIAACGAAGFAFGALLAGRGAHPSAMMWAMPVAATLLLVALIDLRTNLIPLAAVAAVLGAGIARAAVHGLLPGSILGATAGGAAFALLWVAARPLRARAATTPFGFGDVLLAAGIGAVVGWPSVLPTLFLGAVFGAVGAVALLATRSARATDAVPYGVFLCAAALVAEIART